MRVLNTLVLLVLTNLTVFGTAQCPDKIFYNGKEYMLHTNPMESYFAQYPDTAYFVHSTSKFASFYD